MASVKHMKEAIAVILTAATFLCGVGDALRPAAAIEAAVAKQCNALVAKNFPPRVPGNPAAGSKAGDAKQQRAYFKTCVDNNGKMDDASAAEPRKK